MIKAMVEAGIPIDMVGGTSIGSFIGGLWCDERNVTRVIHRARHWFGTMTSLWKQIFDITYPLTSMMTGNFTMKMSCLLPAMCLSRALELSARYYRLLVQPIDRGCVR